MLSEKNKHFKINVCNGIVLTGGKRKALSKGYIILNATGFLAKI